MTATNKNFKSIFAPDLDIDGANFLAEQVIKNKILWWQSTGKVIHLPTCAFWRKDIVDRHPYFKQLAKDYILEVAYVKKLLHCFSLKTILEYIHARKVITFSYKKLDQQRTILYDLWQADVKYKSEQRKTNKKKVSKIEETEPRKSMKNKMSGMF